jgi:Domain of unknown function (DUF4124)
MIARQGGRLFAASIAAAFLCTATAASAQLAVYKSIDSEGRITYTDRQEPESQLVDGAESAAPAAEPRRRALPSRGSALVNANEAKRRLAQAERKRKLGKTPLAGESTQGPDGTTVSYRYWQRQEKLRVEVEKAQRRANAVQRPVFAQQQ